MSKIFSILLTILILATIGGIIYILTSVNTGESFTEFYILNTDGKADNYPKDITVNKSASIILGLVNHEGEPTEYYIHILIDGKEDHVIGPVILSDDERWEAETGFIPDKNGENQKIEFLLYKGEESVPYDTLSLVINVLSD